MSTETAGITGITEITEIRETIRCREAVVVGIDGSKANVAAVDWAADVAHTAGVPLVLAHVVDSSLRSSRFVTIGQVRKAANAIVFGAADQVVERHPDVEVIFCQQFGHPSSTLRDIAAEARVLVLGRRGRNGFSRMLVGSVSSSIGNQAVVPTAVIPESWSDLPHREGAVVVGVDGSPASDAALAYAFAAAPPGVREVRVVYAWGPDGLMPAEQIVAYGGMQLWRKEATALVQGLTAPWRNQHPELTITDVVRQGHPVGTLADESEDARLLIVGGHRAGRLHAALVASTTNGILHHAACPVIVIPEPA
jgi:nucleotide-binding universal stress UspA family protein